MPYMMGTQVGPGWIQNGTVGPKIGILRIKKLIRHVLSTNSKLLCPTSLVHRYVCLSVGKLSTIVENEGLRVTSFMQW